MNINGKILWSKPFFPALCVSSDLKAEFSEGGRVLRLNSIHSCCSAPPSGIERQGQGILTVYVT